ncbi:unnamed protein product [Caenorhabditis sp. 36 PRJEB53466]|nr:unnamed protein product [Caenorhabditis sp. 36 PRJEB53466]
MCSRQAHQNALMRLQQEFHHVELQSIKAEFVVNGHNLERTRRGLARIAGGMAETRKAQYRARLEGLHRERLAASECRRSEVETRICEAVAEWNATFHATATYFDLHGLTKCGAVSYVRSILEATARKAVHRVIRMETGRGNHSPRNLPAIKMALLREYPASTGKAGPGKWTARQDEHNPGVLVFTLN